MTTIGTLLSGGELVGVGARQAGISHLWGFEWVDVIAGVARANGFNVTTADVMTLDPHTLPIPDILHASPVCKRASNANQSAELNEDGTKEAPEDIEMGEKIAHFIDVMTPRIVTIENVYAYRHFKAFKAICASLDRNGYMWDFDNLNSADFGVPQTRRRLILRARRGALLPMLPQPTKWVGWYSGIEDLIPTLPESRFADWQLARLLEELKDHLLFEPTEMRDNGQQLLSVQPCCTLKASRHENFKAFILDQINNSSMTIRQNDEPIFTQSVYNSKHQPPRAWLSQGRVVRMTPRALARFQSMPDSYILPASNKLACVVIGNGVPCKLYETIIRDMI